MGFYVYPQKNIAVFFGSQQEAFVPALYKHMLSSELMNKEPFVDVARTLGLQQIVFLHQTHGILGDLVDDQNQPVFTQEGDFILTTTKHIGIAVATADCVPLVMYSTKHPVVGVVHAGWRGTVAGIITVALDAFMEQIDGDTESIRVLIGPAARVCCYQVSADFVDNLAPDMQHFVSIKNNGQYVFDSVGYNKQLIRAYGLPDTAVYDTVCCTMHEQGYCSHRASGGHPERQYTLVALK